MADALGLGPSGETRESSNLSSDTIKSEGKQSNYSYKNTEFIPCFCCILKIYLFVLLEVSPKYSDPTPVNQPL